MSVPVVVLVSGPPGAGKTTLARRLGPALGLPVLSRDDLKETIFDAIGWSDREWSKRVGAASWELVFLLMERMLAAGTSVLVESNFVPEHRERLADLRRRYPFTPVEVYCFADGATLAHRFHARRESGERHPGHGDPEAPVTADAAALWITHRHPPLGITEHVVRVDTGDPDAIDLGGIVDRIGEGIRGHQDR